MNKNTKSLHERAVRLVEGGIVEVDGLMVKAIKAPIDFYPCESCDMDCLCHKDDDTEMAYLCMEVDSVGRDGYYLKLVNDKE